MLRILAPTRYPWRFNGPRQSRHRVENRDFVPFNKLSPAIEGITLFNPWPPRRFDLVHAFNRIPLGPTPFLIGFESHLPRAFGAEGGRYWRWLVDRLASPRCRAIVAISRYAERVFLDQHAGAPQLEALRRKLHVRLPNLPAADSAEAVTDEAPADGEPLRVAFVGNHFGRKGGCVGVRMAELALARGVPLQVEIVSKLEVGGDIWTDPPDPAFFSPYLEALHRLPNIRHHPGLGNDAVLALLRRSPFSLLATFSDTFGYSAIEAMSQGSVVIATRQGALPECLDDGESGVLLDLPLSPLGEWQHVAGGAPRRDPAYAALYRDEIERLATEALDRITAIASVPGRLAAMRRAARRAAAARFSARAADSYWDDLYTRAAAGVVPAG